MKRDKTETKVYKKKKCQEILKKGIISEEDTTFLLKLIEGHPDYDSKVGCGIEGFCIKRTYWNNNCFFIKRLDGTETDFSYSVCLKPRSHIQKVKAACRTAITKDMMIVSRPGYIAHHETPFKEIFERWISKKDIEKLEMNESKDNCITTSFKDESITKDFRDFHNSIAKIKEVTIEEHKKIHHGGKDGDSK